MQRQSWRPALPHRSFSIWPHRSFSIWPHKRLRPWGNAVHTVCSMLAVCPRGYAPANNWSVWLPARMDLFGRQLTWLVDRFLVKDWMVSSYFYKETLFNSRFYVKLIKKIYTVPTSALGECTQAKKKKAIKKWWTETQMLLQWIWDNVVFLLSWTLGIFLRACFNSANVSNLIERKEINLHCWKRTHSFSSSWAMKQRQFWFKCACTYIMYAS